MQVAGAPLHPDGLAVVMVHGRNAGPENILDLVPRLGLHRQDVTFLAPAAPGRTWYPYSFMADIAQNEPSLSASLALLDGVVSDVIARGLPADRIALLGFSQGGCLASEFAIRHPRRYGGLVLYSAGLIGPPGTTWTEHGSFDGTPVFLGCSDVDGHVPAERVRDSAAAFERLGASVTLRLYPGMGHFVNDDEIMAGRAILEGVGGRQ